MAITQARLHKLLSAASAYMLQLEGQRALLSDYNQQIRAGTLTKEQAYDELAMQLAYNPTPAADVVVGREQMHYRLTHRKNTKTRERRARQGITGGGQHYYSATTPGGLDTGGQPSRSAAQVQAQLEAEEGDLDDISLESEGSELDELPALAEIPDGGISVPAPYPPGTESTAIARQHAPKNIFDQFRGLDAATQAQIEREVEAVHKQLEAEKAYEASVAAGKAKAAGTDPEQGE